MTSANNSPACVGRERSCAQCSTIYRSPRASSRFCSTACRVRGYRKQDPRQGEILRKRLEGLGFIGPVRPWNSKNPRPTTQGLLVPIKQALCEINERFNRPSVLAPGRARLPLAEALAAPPAKLKPDMTEQEFKSLLRKQGIELPSDHL